MTFKNVYFLEPQKGKHTGVTFVKYSTENHMDKSSGDWRSPEGGCTWTASDDLDPWGREWHVSDSLFTYRYILWAEGFLWLSTWPCAGTSFLWETLVVPPHCHLDLQSPNKHPGRHRGVKSDWSGAGVPGGAPVVHFWTHWSRSPWPEKSKDETEISGRKVRWRNNREQPKWSILTNAHTRRLSSVRPVRSPFQLRERENRGEISG